MSDIEKKGNNEKGQFDLSKIDPASLNGSELYHLVNEAFYPFIRFHQSAAWVNSRVNSLMAAIEEAEISGKAAIDTASHYQGSILHQDLHQNYLKLMDLKDFVSKFEPIREEDTR
nr:hypothetical protein [Providencia rustigianii]